MSMKHTPGPWSVSMPPQNSRRVMMPDDCIEVRAPGGMVACLYATNADMHGNADRANAHLIAAAPALYAELARMVDHFEVFASDHSMEASSETWAALHCAKSALAQARGDLVDPLEQVRS